MAVLGARAFRGVGTETVWEALKQAGREGAGQGSASLLGLLGGCLLRMAATQVC